MQSTHGLRPSIDGGDATVTDHVGGDWKRFLRCWTLVAGFSMLGLFVVFSIVQGAAADSPLAEKYEELAGATASPGLYRLASVFDVAVWLGLGGMFVAFGAVLARQAKVRSTLVMACGIGQIAGVIGAFTRLEGLTELAADYTGTGAEQQAELLRSSLDLELVVYTHFAAGSLLWTTALFLVASVGWRMVHFPRWLAALMAVTGVLNLTTDVFGIVTVEDVPDAISLLALTGLMAVFFGVARAFRRKSPLGSVETASV